ncbi:MAG TPA: gephyrin-like molybdotransferase Glp [candidate division Zixibacteria bacterium]|nr:gephyrin-like molybdotransferase Glp [candidate division Zixibacteria bacterium]
MISVEKAVHLVLKNVSPLRPTRVPIEKALGRVSAKTVKAPFDLPRFASSAMDGFALRSSDTRLATSRKPVELALQPKTIFAGPGRKDKLLPKTAVRIMTGAPLPKNADCVLPQEEVWLKNGQLILPSSVPAGCNVRPRGEDCIKGELVLKPGSFIDPLALAFLSALGIKRIAVYRPARVAIIITGDEVSPLTVRRLPDGGVYDTHSSFLKAALCEFGLKPVSLAYVRDRFGSLVSKMKRALRDSDLLLVTGGVSVGERDFVRPAANRLGVKTIFWGAAQKPGKPLFFGRKGNHFVFGLPGNPAAAVVCYLEYVRPALRRMLGFSECAPVEISARLVRPVNVNGNRTIFLRAGLSARRGNWYVRPAGKQGSHLLRSFTASNCLAVIPKGMPNEKQKKVVNVHPYPWRTI